jgi:hypothetical protein
MPRLPITALSEGMRLASDVKAPSGQVLLVAGTELIGKHFAVLKAWHIPAVDVESGAATALDPALLDRARREIAPRFIRQDTSLPVIRTLFTLIAERRVRELGPTGSDHAST